MTDVFSIPDFKMPEGFLWGSATAAHQVEGNNIHNNYWHDEQEALKKDPNYEVSGMACNHYNMVEEDSQLVKDLGHQAFRMSIEWARIEPIEGHFNEEAAEHYVRELALLKSLGIQTFVTLFHFTMPQWFLEKGAFYTLENRKYFERYIHYIVPKISPYTDFWNVINEFNLGTPAEAMTRKFNGIFFHSLGYHLIKKYSDKPVSSAHAMVQSYAKRQHDVFDRTMQAYLDIVNNEFFFHAIRTGEVVLPYKQGVVDKSVKDTCDFWSINLYTRDMVDTRSPDLTTRRYPFSETRMINKDFYLDEFYPECIFHNMTRLMDKPVYITENGCSCDDDDFRIVYLAEYLSAVHLAIQAGVDIRGYLYWSLMDNYEWGSFLPRFGLVNVDREKGFKRTPKPSAFFYKEIIENNGFSQELLKKYLKDVPRTVYRK